MDPYRLPRTALPRRYDIRLEPDLTTLTFRGEETVTLDVTESVSELLLNAVELAIDAASLENDRGQSIPATVSLDEAAERAHLALAAPATSGRWRLRLTFRGALNDKLRGFYRSSYKDATGATRLLAATQFEATDARRAFPCWDEPAFKAVFAVTLAIDPALTAVSNTRVVAERREGGKKVLAFADTITMSTYLVAFVVGELEATEPVVVGRTPVRVWCVPGKKGLAAFGHAVAVASLRFFEEYYGMPYPGDKLDLLAIPDFAAGAMENLGAITFRETALLVDERAASHTELERVADVVAHENAHMWFGDLVTMTWWNGIWLNEAFATFMEMLSVDAWKPEWRRWTTFGVSRAAALTVDGLHSTRPIEFPVRAPRDADAMFDVLTYEKGASVLRMLEQYLGADVFREGVRDYLRRHAYANADTGDLWQALGSASGQPIPAVMDGWIFKPGYPLVSARLDGRELVLAQQRFTYLREPSPGVSSAAESDQRWQVPVQIRVHAGGRHPVTRLLLAEGETRVPQPASFDAVVVNEGGHGFYRVRYTGDLLERLLARLAALAPIERFNLVNDAWAVAVAGLMSLTDYLELTARFREERDRNVWSVLIASLGALHRIVEEADRPRLAALVRDRLGPAFAALAWTPRPEEDELTRQLRGDLARALGVLGDDRRVQAEAAGLYAAHLGGREVDPNVLPALIAILAHAGDAARYDEFLTRFKSATTPQEEQRYLYALAGFRQPELLERTLARTLDGEIRTQDAPFVAHALLLSVHARELAWTFVKKHWDAMDRQYPKHGLRRMAEGVTGLTTPELERDVHAFFRERKIELGGKTLAQYLEQLHIAVSLRAREGVGLAKYLARFA
ncbi:MAG TPA: M1 family metallopeptidase [Methylomirabilota bacterium]|nr:M1 family metallopeptidase [Methylomirabilota bacterium]